MTRALWLADTKPPKQFSVRGEKAMVIAIKNSTLKARLLPETPEMMTVRTTMDWAELVRRVATSFGVNMVLIDKSFALDPLLLTLQHTLSPYHVALRAIE
jgi:hypothetical protein